MVRRERLVLPVKQARPVENSTRRVPAPSVSAGGRLPCARPLPGTPAAAGWCGGRPADGAEVTRETNPRPRFAIPGQAHRLQAGVKRIRKFCTPFGTGSGDPGEFADDARQTVLIAGATPLCLRARKALPARRQGERFKRGAP